MAPEKRPTSMSTSWRSDGYRWSQRMVTDGYKGLITSPWTQNRQWQQKLSVWTMFIDHRTIGRIRGTDTNSLNHFIGHTPIKIIFALKELHSGFKLFLTLTELYPLIKLFLHWCSYIRNLHYFLRWQSYIRDLESQLENPDNAALMRRIDACIEKVDSLEKEKKGWVMEGWGGDGRR